MLAVPDIEEVKRYFRNTLDKCNNAITTKLNNCTQTFLKYKTNYILNNPMKLYEIQEQKLDTLYDRLNISLRNTLMSSSILLERYKNNYIIKNPLVLFDDKKNKLEYLKTKAELLNPNNILDKGYSIVYKDNKVVKDITKLSENDNINIMVKDGNINAKVEGINKKWVKNKNIHLKVQ